MLGGMLCASSGALADEQEAVVLLHGYGRTGYSMLFLESRLKAEGYRVCNVGYPSMRRSPTELTEFLHREVNTCCSDATRVHFVTHSLGGILVRAWLSEHRPHNLGRVVMLAPPNRGSELADIANGLSLLHPILGPTVLQLGTAPASLPNRLPPPWYGVGVIAGVDNFNPVGGFFVPEPSDGTVSVSSTRLGGMSDFITVAKSHTFIMWSAEVADYVVRFLRTGHFLETEPPDIPADQ